MTFDWRLSTWGDEVSLEYGKALRGYQDGKLGFRVFGSNGPIGWTDKALAAGPGVILGRKGAYRGVHFSKEPFFVIDTAYYVQPKYEMDKRWLYYAIQHHKLGEIDDGSPIPSTTRAAVYVRELRVPRVSEQREIGRVLVALDDRIDHNRALATTLETIARQLFKSWFVDFDPVRAKATGEKSTGLADDIAALFPDQFEDSELGEIPEKWKIGTLNDVCELNPETWSARNHPDVLEYIDLSNVKSGGVENATSYLWEESPSRARRVLRCGDTIVGTVRPGNRSFALIATDGLTGSTGFAVLRPCHQHHREYVYLSATADDAIERLAHLADGAAYPAVRPDVVTGAEVVVPEDEILRQFSAITAPIFEQIAVCQNESSVLSSLRDVLLPRLISGKLRVEDAESIIEDAIA